jgi:hypothetical protein
MNNSNRSLASPYFEGQKYHNLIYIPCVRNYLTPKWMYLDGGSKILPEGPDTQTCIRSLPKKGTNLYVVFNQSIHSNLTIARINNCMNMTSPPTWEERVQFITLLETMCTIDGNGIKFNKNTEEL